MPAITTTVNFDVLVDGYAESGSIKEINNVICYEVNWADRIKFLDDAFLPPSGPWIHPDFVNAKVREFRIVGKGAQDHDASKQTLLWEKAHIYLTYKTDDKDSSDPSGKEISTEFDVGAQYLSLPEGEVKWGDGTDFKGDIGFPMPHMDISHTLSGLASFSPGSVVAFCGTINENPWNGFSRGQVLFDGCKAKVEHKAGNSTWTATYTLKARREDWNKFYRPETDAWEFTDPLLLPYKDFSGLGI